MECLQHFETLNFKMSPDASALKNLCLWCEFQSRLLFIISQLLENILTALRVLNVHIAEMTPKLKNIPCIHVISTKTELVL